MYNLDVLNLLGDPPLFLWHLMTQGSQAFCRKATLHNVIMLLVLEWVSSVSFPYKVAFC